MRIPINEIKIGSRIRQNLGELDTLAKSIEKVGLIHPIIVSEKYELLSGHRRLEACKLLGHETIEAKVVSIGDDDVAKIDWEYHENIGRKELETTETRHYVTMREEYMSHKRKSFWKRIAAFFKRLFFFWKKG